MLRRAVRTVLADASGRAPSADAWALLLVAAGVEETKAATLPSRLGYVFHLGAYDEGDVVAQLDAWAAALRVRAEPDVAEVVHRAAVALREEVERDPQPLPAAAPHAPAAAPPAPAATAPPHAPPPPAPAAPAVRQRPRDQQQRGQQQRGQQQRGQQRRRPPQQQHPQQAPPSWAPPPPGAAAPGGQQAGRTVRPARPARRPRWPLVVGITGTVLLLSCCLVGLLADLLGSGS